MAWEGRPHLFEAKVQGVRLASGSHEHLVDLVDRDLLAVGKLGSHRQLTIVLLDNLHRRGGGTEVDPAHLELAGDVLHAVLVKARQQSILCSIYTVMQECRILMDRYAGDRFPGQALQSCRLHMCGDTAADTYILWKVMHGISDAPGWPAQSMRMIQGSTFTRAKIA